MKEIIDTLDETYEGMRKTLQAKNTDYAGDAGTFANFELGAKLSGTRVEQGVFTRFIDKIQRISSFLKAGKLVVENESVVDAIDDAIGYLIILKAWIRKDARLKKDL